MSAGVPPAASSWNPSISHPWGDRNRIVPRKPACEMGKNVPPSSPPTTATIETYAPAWAGGRREGRHERRDPDRREHAAEHEERHTERVAPRGTEQPRGRSHQQHGAHESDQRSSRAPSPDHRAGGDRRHEQPRERALLALLEQTANAELHREEEEEDRHADREERGLRRHLVLGGGRADLGALRHRLGSGDERAVDRAARPATVATEARSRRGPRRTSSRSTRPRATRSGRRAPGDHLDPAALARLHAVGEPLAGTRGPRRSRRLGEPFAARPPAAASRSVTKSRPRAAP